MQTGHFDVNRKYDNLGQQPLQQDSSATGVLNVSLYGHFWVNKTVRNYLIPDVKFLYYCCWKLKCCNNSESHICDRIPFINPHFDNLPNVIFIYIYTFVLQKQCIEVEIEIELRFYVPLGTK